MRSIKTKLILGLSALIILLFSLAAFLLIDEKQKELTGDIYLKARSFSELTTPKIADLYVNFLAQDSHVIFTRELKDIFRKNEDISEIKIFSFGGDILYDSSTELERIYEGDLRRADDSALEARIKANLPSYLLANGRTVYLKKDSTGVYSFVDENEKEVAPLESNDQIQNIIFPYDAKYAVEFDVTYENLRARVIRTTERIVLLLVFGILLGLGFGWYFAGRITTPIGKLTEGALILAKGDFATRVEVKTRDEVGMLAETFNKMAGDLEVSMKALVYKERVAKELEVAAHLQRQILPKSMPNIKDLDVAAMVIPAAEIGGDCYDFIKVSDENHLLYISDVTGHGVPSGIVVSIANALIYSYSKLPSLADIIINSNRVLKEKTAQNMFMTLLMLRYAEGKLSYVSAGHPEMMHYYGSEKKVVAEKGGGIALGMVPDVSKLVHEVAVPFNGGDVIVLYSDGIPEGVNERGEMYGPQRLKLALSNSGELESAEAIRNVIIADVKEFMGQATQMDDITLVVIKKK